MGKLGLKELPVADKRVLMRVDFNVPLDGMRVTDETRLIASLPSIQYVLENGGRPILMSHLGRPKGGAKPELSLAPVAERLHLLLGVPVHLAPDCVGPEVEAMANNLKAGEVLLLENLRFHPGEEHPDKEPDFVERLAELGDVYVNDAFGTAHRAHASTAAVASHFPNAAAAGFLLQEEIRFLGDNMLEPKRPFAAIIGGAKVSSKIGVLEALVEKADVLMIGGAMTFTFMKAEGMGVGDSLFEPEFVPQAKAIMNKCAERHVQFCLPNDLLIARERSNHTPMQIIPIGEEIPQGYQGVDVGPHTIEEWRGILEEANTIFWNGPLGIFEVSHFAKGTFALAHVLSEMNAITVVGAGDSVAAVNRSGVAEGITHLSTGGGASLEYIEHGSLPGIEALSNSK